VTPGANFKGATIALVDTNGQWDTTTGSVMQWGLQQSNDGGANWEWGPVFQGDINDSSRWLAFGTRGKGSAMPSLAIDSSDFVGGSGTQLRLAIQVSAQIRLGAQIDGA
jgi:hypothetical protein